MYSIITSLYLLITITHFIPSPSSSLFFFIWLYMLNDFPDYFLLTKVIGMGEEALILILTLFSLSHSLSPFRPGSEPDSLAQTILPTT